MYIVTNVHICINKCFKQILRLDYIYMEKISHSGYFFKTCFQGKSNKKSRKEVTHSLKIEENV